MKKLISFMLALLMIMPCVSAFASAKEIDNDKAQSFGNIQSFIDNALELTDNAPVIQDVPIANNGSIGSEADSDSGYDFETCRLVVESEEKPDKLNSVGIASGFMNYHIVQFANAKDTEKAFEYYQNEEDVISVFVDEFMDFSEIEVTENSAVEFDIAPSRLNTWGADYTGFYELKDYLANKKFTLEDVVVGVVDTGVDLDHEFLQGRLIRTYFNSSGRGQKNDENDQSNGHGTMVSSVIVDSTPDNVKVAVYKTTTTLSSLSLGCLQAIEDEVDVINASFGGFAATAPSEADYWQDIVDCAYEKNIVFVAAAGNDEGNLDRGHNYPSDCEHAISVGAIDEYYMPTDFTNYGRRIDVSAPGKFIIVAIPGSNPYAYANGTSFSSPYTASLYAMYKSLYPDSTVDEITEAVKSNTSAHSPYFTMHKGIDKLFGTGIIDAIGTSGLGRQAKIKVNIEPGDYDGAISIELSSEGADEIYYTLDGRVPGESNGILYQKPIKISSGGVIVTAVAYNKDKLRSEIFSGLYKIWEEAPEESFTIGEEGQLQSYIGKSSYVKIPETINGITVKSVGTTAFKNSKAEGVILPETVTELSKYAFNGENDKVKYVYGEGVKTIGYCAFGSSDSVIYVDFPNAEFADESAFSNTKTLFGLDLPKLKEAGYGAFNGCKKMLRLNLPELESAGMHCFENSGNLYDVYLPKLNTISGMDKFSTGSLWFYGSRVYNAVELPSAEKIYELDFLSITMENRVKRAEFSNLKKWLGGDFFDEPSYSTLKHTLVLPSTVETITVGQSDYIDGYIIYGSKGTYVEQWANEQKYLDVTFIEITPETAVVTDLPECHRPYMGELVADVAGFNKQYQWYANTVDSNKGGTPIDGATGRSFDPADYPAPYYYCEVISTDKGYDPVLIKTTACKNMELEPVDFTPLNNALKKVPEDLTIYDKGKDALVRIVEEAKNSENLNQLQVNGLARELENALKNLEKIEVNLSSTEITLMRGDTFKLKAETVYGLLWSSSDNAVASVDYKGTITAVAPGEATIIATIAGMNISAECKVTVLPKKFTVTWIIDDDKTVSIVNEGEEIIRPENPHKDGYIFKGWTPEVPDKMPSEDVEFIAVFTDCRKLEKALDKVPSDLSAYTSATRSALEDLLKQSENAEELNQEQIDELVAKIEKAVSDLKLITITLSDKNITLIRGDVFRISAESELPVTWTSTNKDVATVDENGVVTTKWRGETTIIATVESLGITAECNVTVVPQKFIVTWNIDGAKIKVKLNEGDEIVEPEISRDNFRGWTPEVPDIMPSENVEFTAVFEKADVTSVKIKSKPTKLDYVYKTDSLDLAGLILEVSYSDGTKEVVNDLSEVKVTDFDNTKLGTQTITIEYEGAKAEFDITVSYAGWQYLILIFLLGFIWY